MTALCVSGRAARGALHWLSAALVFAAVAAPAVAEEPIAVHLDEARILKPPDRAATVVIGDPLIADLSIQPGGLAIVTGKGYGATNVVVLDHSGAVLMEDLVEVKGPDEPIVVVYRGNTRQTYSSARPIARRGSRSATPARTTSTRLRACRATTSTKRSTKRSAAPTRLWPPEPAARTNFLVEHDLFRRGGRMLGDARSRGLESATRLARGGAALEPAVVASRRLPQWIATNAPVPLLDARGFRAAARSASGEGAMFQRAIFPASNTRRAMFSLIRRLIGQSEATTTVEFALLAVPFVAALFAILPALVFFAGRSARSAAATSARLIFTGQAQLNGWTAAQFKSQVCDQIHGIFNCNSGVYVDVETYSSFADVNLGMPVSNGNFNSSSLGYNPGGPGDIVVLRLNYQYPVFVNLLGFNLSNLNGGYNLFAATAVFKNEPYASS